MEADKKIFLISRRDYRKEFVNNLTENDLEELVAEGDYENNYTILKIDANGYNSVEEALNTEVVDESFDPDDYYIFQFGF